MSDKFEQRIIKAIDDGTNLSAADLATLIDQTQAAIVAAEEAARVASERAFDPALSNDPLVARDEMETAHLRVGRLKTLLPRLQRRLARAHEREDGKRWQQDYNRLKPKRDALAVELRDFYPTFAAKLAGLLDRIAANDVELSQLNSSRPNGASGAYLYGAELTARELGGFSRVQPSLSKQLQLPDWQQSDRLIYPPPRPSPAAAYAATLAPAYGDHRGANWWIDVELKQAAQRQESERVGQFYQDQEKRREDRANAEAEARAVPK